MIYKNGVFYQINHSEGRAIYSNTVWSYEFDYKDYLGNTRVSFNFNGKTAENHFDPFGVRLQTGTVNPTQNRFEMQGHEKEMTFGLNRINFGFRTMNTTIGRFDGVDLKAEKMSSWSPFNYNFGNPIRFFDPDGKAPLDVFKQNSDGGYTKINNQGGNRSHTYINNNGTTSYYNVQTGSLVTIKDGTAASGLKNFQHNQKELKSNILNGLGTVNNIGDGLSTVGTVLAPFTEGASLSVTAVGESVSLGATAIKHTIKFSTEGATTENKVDAAIDLTFEVLPSQVEKTVEKSGLEDISKQMIKAEIKQVTMASKIMVDKTVEKSRNKDGE